MMMRAMLENASVGAIGKTRALLAPDQRVSLSVCAKQMPMLDPKCSMLARRARVRWRGSAERVWLRRNAVQKQ